ncbi:MAG: hypothetical protein JNM69_02225 [Archangium sp.]|nr:hypothetical protein [Archangium sp.]
MSSELASRVGIPQGSKAWADVRLELIEYAQRVLQGLRSPMTKLGRGLELPEPMVEALLAGTSDLDVDRLMLVFLRLELPVRLSPKADGAIEVAIGASELRLT